MHILCALSTLFLQPYLIAPTTVISPSAIRDESPIASLNAANASSYGLTGSDSPSTPISLTFVVFGSRIPAFAVNDAFYGAISRIYVFVHNQPEEPITNDNFQYRATGGSVQIGVTVGQHRRISWRQLDAVLREAFIFMNGDLGRRRSHMQELSFEIVNSGTKLGDGLVSYHPSHSLQPLNSTWANETNANDTGVLLPATNPSRDSSTANVIPFPVPNTSLTLLFGFLGNAIPIPRVWAAFEGVHAQIFRPLARHPASPIPDDRFEYNKRGVRIIVFANHGRNLTWQQLSWVMAGMYDFMAGEPEHYQRLTCDVVLADQGSVAFASVYYADVEVTKRATAISSPLAPSISQSVPHAVPDTPIIIEFKSFGTTIPRRDLDNAIVAALDDIGPSCRGHGTDPVPGNHFFRAVNGIHITIVATAPHILSWMQLYDTLRGLMLFVTGADDSGDDRHRVLTFDVNDVRAGTLAYGALRYAASRREKEDASS